MGRLFAGTPWDRPPRCERCGLLESECACPPEPPAPPAQRDPGSQTAQLRVEKRAKGKLVTLVAGLDPERNHLDSLAVELKARCGTGGTVKAGRIELQGDHLATTERVLEAKGYKTRRG